MSERRRDFEKIFEHYDLVSVWLIVDVGMFHGDYFSREQQER